MTTLAAVFSRHIKRSKASYRTLPHPGYLERFRHFIENSDWDAKILGYEKWIDRVCLGIIGASFVYFIPVMVKILFR